MSVSQNLMNIARAIPKARKDSLGVGGLSLVHDALKESPTPPIDTANLRGSWAVDVEGEFVSRGESSKDASLVAKVGQAVVSFNTPYAHYQHEGISHSHKLLKPGPKSQAAGDTGPKFLEKKLLVNKTKYFTQMANRFWTGISKVLYS